MADPSENTKTAASQDNNSSMELEDDSEYLPFQPDGHKLNKAGRDLVDTEGYKLEHNPSYCMGKLTGDKVGVCNKATNDHQYLFTRLYDTVSGRRKGISMTSEKYYVNGGKHFKTEPDGTLTFTNATTVASAAKTTDDGKEDSAHTTQA